ncbi:MAG: dihydrodipicolinate synthase family protein [Acidimicrobiaceae bacterium]|nr:dihydrodipicolinate synthase family protein [Acidimicrobiaceae bacterium]
MHYARGDAKAYAHANMKGIWAAALTPFTEDGQLDEDGFSENVRHWTEDLGIAGLFVCGKQGEFFSMSPDERKRCLELAVEAVAPEAQTIMSCSDQNLDVVLDLARHAQIAGADFIVVHAPTLHFVHEHDETVYRYYKTISQAVDIGMALWSHPDSGYLMSPQLCNRLADLDNVVAIKYSVPRPMYAELTALASDRIRVSTASEDEWLDNILELDWQLYLCSSPPFLLQTATDRRMHDYTQAAFAGDAAGARRISESLNPVRDALKRTRPAEKPHAHQKYWQDLLGQVGGRVRPPLLELTDDEKAATREAFDQCGLRV